VTPGEGGDKPMRADARRNRAKVLEVADRVFTERGTGVSTEEIAREAGVGIGTVFRHFPTKEALLEAVFVGRFARTTEMARGLADAEDPGAALSGFVTAAVHESATKNAFVAALEEAGVSIAALTSPVRGELRAALQVLLERAQRAGAVRDDIGAPELEALMVGAARAAEYTAGNPEVRDRALAVTLDGLKPPAPRR
jgi:AcrR family transcriptional regulator